MGLDIKRFNGPILKGVRPMLETAKFMWDELKPHPGNAIALGGLLLVLGLCYAGIQLEEKFGFRAYDSFRVVRPSATAQNYTYPCPPIRK